MVEHENTLVENEPSQSIVNGEVDDVASEKENENKDTIQSEKRVEASQNENNEVDADTEQGVPAASNSDDAPWSIWTSRQKKMIILTASLASFFSPLSTVIYLPALDTIAADLNVSNSLINLSITTYMIFQGLAPTFTAQLSDTAGRRPSYMICFGFYMAANIGLGIQNSYPALLVLRCLQSAGSSGTIALSSAVVADLVTSAERGLFMSWASTVPMIGPALGPVLGGVLAQYAGWHFIFWFLLILAGLVAIPMGIFFPETCHKLVGDGSIPPPKWDKCYTNVLLERKTLREGKTVRYDKREELAKNRHIQFPNPFGTLLLLLQRECGYALLYSGLLCCSFYVTLSLIPSQFAIIYNFNELQIALCYIPFGIGSLMAAFIRGRLMDAKFRQYEKRLGISTERNYQTDLTNFPIERVRLEVAVPTILFGSLCIIGFGWTLQYKTNLAGPLILLFFIAYCVTSSMNCIAVLMVDIYPGRAGTVSASNNLTRCFLGAGATALILPMIDGIGIGWSLTFFGLVNLAALPLLWYVMKQGPKWRAETQQKKLDQQNRPTE